MKLWISGILFFVLTACGNPQVATKTKKSEGLRYAEHFNLIAHGNYQELQILNPDNGSVEKKYALVKRGQRVDFPAGMVQIEVPLKSIVALSGTHIGMLEKLKRADRVAGISSKRYVDNPTVLKGCASGKVLEFEDFGMLNPERVLQTAAEVIMYSGFEGASPPNEDKLLKIGILCVPNYDWKENHPLGKAEWIKVFGALFDLNEVAENYFTSTEKEYVRLTEIAANIPEKPAVFSGMVFGDSWYMPAGESYGAKLIEDAGGNYVAKNEKGTGSVTYSFEQVFKKNQHTEFWVNVEVPTKAEMLQANVKYQYFDAFKTGKIYSYAHQMNYFWENSAIEPDKILSDLIRIFHPGKTKSGVFHYYRQLTK